MCTKAKTRIRQLLSQAKTQELWKTLLLHPLYLQGHLEKKLFPSTSTSTISTDFDSASLPRDFEADPASGSASGWDVRNDIDVGKKNVRRSSEFFWLGTMILQKYPSNDLEWVISVKFFWLLSCCERSKMVIQPSGRSWQKPLFIFASQHSQFQNFKRTDIFPVSSFSESESEMSSFCWSSAFQRCIMDLQSFSNQNAWSFAMFYDTWSFTSQYQIPLVYS